MTAGRAVQGTTQWLSWESALGDEAWEEGCRMVALGGKISLSLFSGTVTSCSSHSHNVSRGDLREHKVQSWC